jgi:hypothetical protein
MQRVAIVSSVLGLGTVLVFGAAVLAGALFPNGGTVQMGWSSGGWDKGIAIPAPMPVPAIERNLVIDDGKGLTVEDPLIVQTELVAPQP